MKNILKFSMLGLLGLVMITSACKKKPSAQIYADWTVADAKINGMDDVTADKLKSDVLFSFKKDGNYSYAGSINGGGTFKINEEGTSISTTEDGNSTTFDLMLNETQMHWTNGDDYMKFNIKK